MKFDEFVFEERLQPTTWPTGVQHINSLSRGLSLDRHKHMPTLRPVDTCMFGEINNQLMMYSVVAVSSVFSSEID